MVILYGRLLRGRPAASASSKLISPGIRMPDISVPTASEARYWSGVRSGRGLNGADRSVLTGFGSMPIGGVGMSWAGSRDSSRDRGEGWAAADGTGNGSPVSWKAASRTPTSAFGTPTPDPGGFGSGGMRPGREVGDVPVGSVPEFAGDRNGDSAPAGGIGGVGGGSVID